MKEEIIFYSIKEIFDKNKNFCYNINMTSFGSCCHKRKTALFISTLKTKYQKLF